MKKHNADIPNSGNAGSMINALKKALNKTASEELSHSSIRLDRLDEKIDRYREEFQDKPLCKTIAIYDLDSDRYSLNFPLNIELEIYEEEVIARFSELELWSSGSNESEAIMGFKEQLVCMTDDLLGFERDGKKLGKLPKMWLNTIKKIIKY